MSDNSRISQHIHLLLAQMLRVHGLRASLAAIALFCIATTMAPPVLAQSSPPCGPAIQLSANQWRMVGIPCVPRENLRTIKDVFGPSLGIPGYGVTWVAWKRVYSDNQCVVSSGPADCYVKLTLASPANVGDAFWIYTTQAKTLNFASTLTRTPGPNFPFPARLATDGNSRYYMFANPYGATVRWADLLFATTLTLFGNTVPVEATTQQAINLSIVSKNVNYWNGNTYFTRDLNSPEATFVPKEAAWLEMLTPAAIVTSGVTVKVPQP